MYTGTRHEIIVVGGGHAGCEAALASARMGINTCLFTMNIDTIAQLSCNPAVGGLAKGHLVREIDALGGEMAKVTDSAGIQFRILNKSKGPAVWSLRAQVDRDLYRLSMKKALESEPNLTIMQASVERLEVEAGKVEGVITSLGAFYGAKAVIVTTGTFLKGLIHIGMENFPAGRAGEFPSIGLSEFLRRLGLRMGRLKTGTPPRIDSKTIDFSRTTRQYGDFPPHPFSCSTDSITNPQLPCHITHTNERTHRLISENLARSPLYSGRITGVGPRYCPSIEDKIVRFPGRLRHQVFLEPEGLQSSEYYANGISTSLPYDLQVKLVRTIEGLEETEIMRPGYAIEYDYVHSTQLKHSLEIKSLDGIFLAGQINGTSGYEEAAAQGLMAGINAACKVRGEVPFVLERGEAYIGVLIDDLVTRGTEEPYRIFTSRAEYRLLLRHDNADFRLTEKGYSLGLVSEEAYERLRERKKIFRSEMKRIGSINAKPDVVNPVLVEMGTAAVSENTPLVKLMKRPEVTYDIVDQAYPSPDRLDEELRRLLETEIRYEGYIKRQIETVERVRRSEARRIPPDFEYDRIQGLSREVLGKLKEMRPESIGQAGRIPGVTPAAVTLIMVAIEKGKRAEKR